MRRKAEEDLIIRCVGICDEEVLTPSFDSGSGLVHLQTRFGPTCHAVDMREMEGLIFGEC